MHFPGLRAPSGHSSPSAVRRGGSNPPSLTDVPGADGGTRPTPGRSPAEYEAGHHAALGRRPPAAQGEAAAAGGVFAPVRPSDAAPAAAAAISERAMHEDLVARLGAQAADRMLERASRGGATRAEAIAMVYRRLHERFQGHGWPAAEMLPHTLPRPSFAPGARTPQAAPPRSLGSRLAALCCIGRRRDTSRRPSQAEVRGWDQRLARMEQELADMSAAAGGRRRDSPSERTAF